MSFGTGHHATTSMVIGQMREIDFNGKKVFDFGTGTDILAILAEKLGAREVTAIDNDEWSISNAQENFERNQCKRIRLEKAETAQMNDSFDVILENMPAISKQLKPGGQLLLSGLLVTDEYEIMSVARSNSFTFCKKTVENNWICLRFSH